MRSLPLLLLLAATNLFAADTPRQPFPDDYVKPRCAPSTPCATFPKVDLPRIAFLRGYTVDGAWIDAHLDEILTALQPFCDKAGACFANPRNRYTFCNDVIAPQVTSACTIYPDGSEDRRKCDLLVRILWTGFDRSSKPIWQNVQTCGAADEDRAEKTLDVWMSPDQIAVRPGEQARFVVYALDSTTKVPVQARVAVEGQKIYAVDVTDGKPTANLAIDWKPAWVRVPNAQGHRDVVAPTVTVTAEGYKPVSFPMPLPSTQLAVSMTPKRLKPGKNRVTIEVKDAATGAPAEMRVMAGDRVAGRSNEPFELEITGRQPEIWLTSLFDRYSDVVVVPAK